MRCLGPLLAISPPSSEQRIVLACATDAIGLCRQGGYRVIPATRARFLLATLGRREIARVREFLARSRLPIPRLSSVNDATVLRILTRAARTGDFTLLCEGETNDGADAGTKEQRRLVRRIEAKTGRRLASGGRQYRLVADVDLDRLRDRDSYEVVPSATAREVLDELAQRPGANPEVATLLGKAQELLTRDWRPPLSPEGLILLRRNDSPRVYTSVPGDILTPSQMKAVLDPKDWIEIEVIDDTGKPFAGSYRVDRPDGTVDKGTFSGNGVWADRAIDPGVCKLFLELPAEAATSQGDSPVVEPAATRVRLTGMLFDANKCFLLPQAVPGIRTIIAAHDEDPGAEVLIVGHAGSDEDLAGADIAFDRAQIVGAFLKSKPNAWLNWFGPDKPARSRWGTREVQLMLSTLPEPRKPFYRGYASGVTDDKTTAALKKFQAWNNDEKGSFLDTDGEPDFQTRKALVEAYMDIDATTLADDVTPIAHGCEGHFEDTPTASGVQGDDRRLEVFFFAEGIAPRPDATISSAGSSLYATWMGKVAETRDFECHGIHVQIIDAQRQPAPFATVRLTGPTSAKATSDEHGFVSFFGLKQGVYTISSEKNGYKIGVSKLRYPTAQTVTGCARTTEGAP